MQLLRVAWALTGAAICCFLILLIHARLLKEGNYSQLLRLTSHCDVLTRRRFYLFIYLFLSFPQQ